MRPGGGRKRFRGRDGRFAHIRWQEEAVRARERERERARRGREIRLTQRENENEGRDVSTIDHRGSECNANHAPSLVPIP